MAIFKLLLIFFILFLLQHWIYTRRGLRRISYSRSFSEPQVFAGQKVIMEERIINNKWLPIPWLRIETMMPSPLQFNNNKAETVISSGQMLQNHASLFSMGPFTKVVRRHEVWCVRRGVFGISSLSLTLGDLTGTTCNSDTRSSDCTITVYPKVKEIGQLPASLRQWMQGIMSTYDAFREDHYHVAGVRAYRGGDSLRQVNWSATAKTGQMLVNRRETMMDSDMTIVLNAELMDAAENRRILPEAFEEALSYAASVVHHVISNGGKAGLIFNGRVAGSDQTPLQIEPRSGRQHLYQMLESMARFDSVVRLDLGHVLEDLARSRLRGANLLLITAFLTPKQELAVARLRQAGHRVETLLLYREREVASL